MHVRNDAEELSGIECVAGGARVVVASPAIAQIVEYAVSPLPLGRPFISGLAVHAGDLVVSVRATSEVLTVPRRATKAVLLVAKSGASLRCALEIDEGLVVSAVLLVAHRTAPDQREQVAAICTELGLSAITWRRGDAMRRERRSTPRRARDRGTPERAYRERAPPSRPRPRRHPNRARGCGANMGVRIIAGASRRLYVGYGVRRWGALRAAWSAFNARRFATHREPLTDTASPWTRSSRRNLRSRAGNEGFARRCSRCTSVGMYTRRSRVSRRIRHRWGRSWIPCSRT